MSCGFPIKCKYWDGKKCVLSDEEFQRMCESGHNPCEEHQGAIDKQAERDYIKAIERGDKREARAIKHSPFTNFGK